MRCDQHCLNYFMCIVLIILFVLIILCELFNDRRMHSQQKIIALIGSEFSCWEHSYEGLNRFAYRVCALGQHVGSLQAVKESLRRMRWRHERLNNMSMPASSTSVHDDTLRYSTYVDQQHLHHHDRALHRIASELIQYVWDYGSSEGSGALLPPHGTHNGGGRDNDESGVCTETRIISVAMYHQQQRAEVRLQIS